MFCLSLQVKPSMMLLQACMIMFIKYFQSFKLKYCTSTYWLIIYASIQKSRVAKIFLKDVSYAHKNTVEIVKISTVKTAQ